jgi:SAM-dependent methyltransferase
MYDMIEILPVSLLDRQRQCVNALRRLAQSLSLEFGWHYLLDLTWMLSHLGKVNGRRILDAGAGVGILQWYLAEQGAEVLSVDRESRAHLPLRFRRRYRVEGLRVRDLAPAWQALHYQMVREKKPFRKLAVSGWEVMQAGRTRIPEGRVVIYNQDLKNLADIPSYTMDAVVAVSSLEHNPPAELEEVIAELMRVLKPGGKLLATLGAARNQDWFHKPSQGWCYSEASLRCFFDLPASAPANYDQYDELFNALRECAELRDNLAAFYTHSGNNGMPWGVWDPQYQPVGVCKVKPKVAR